MGAGFSSAVKLPASIRYQISQNSRALYLSVVLAKYFWRKLSAQENLLEKLTESRRHAQLPPFPTAR